MKIKPYINKLNDSKEYKDFRKKHKDAFLTAGFFILDLEAGKNVHQVDFYIPSNKKIAAFTLDHHVTLQIFDTLEGSKAPKELDINTNIDLDAIPGILQDEMKNRSITESLKKIIAVIQNLDGKKIWNLNCILSGMELLKAHVEDESGSVLKMDKSSVFDYIKKVPADVFKAQLAGKNPKDAKSPSGSASVVTAKDLAKKKLDDLDKLEKAIEKEKENIQKQIGEKESSKPQVKDSKKIAKKAK